MYVSYNWLKELVDFSYSLEELDNVLTMMGVEVEEIIDYSNKYKGFITAKVIEKEKHPNADKLSVCKVDTGSDIKTVVCGAPNVESGQSVVLGQIGAVVPNGGFKLEKRAVRKIESEGMICSQTELDVGSDSAGIWVLSEDVKPGIPLDEYLNFNDIILDLSLTPNKSDCNSHEGIAREISAVNGNPIKTPEYSLVESEKDINDSMQIIIEDEEKCPRYTCRIIRNVKVSESPDWLKNRLILIGLRPVNVIVDVTNYVLMEMGQPLHAFDLNKIEGNKIICKTPKTGEKFTTLDSKERELNDSMLMICDANRNIAVGGVMGGENSEISDETTDILLESAFFNPSSIRKTSKKLGIQSDASYRFERGVDIENIIPALDRATAMIAELTGGLIDKGIIDVYPSPQKELELNFRYQKARDIIGVDIPNDDMKDMLERLRFEILSSDENSCKVLVPHSRVDVSLEIDLVEEIARLYNYDNIEPDFSVSVSLASSAVPEDLAIPKLRKKLSEYLVNRGFNEIITQNQLDPKSAAIFSDNPVKISNPLGEELSIMRPSIVPAMLRTVERNLRLSAESLKMFEIGRTFHKGINEDTFIKDYLEKEELILAISGKSKLTQWTSDDKDFDYYDIKGIIEDLINFFGFEKYKFSKLKTPNPAFSKNALAIYINKQHVGVFGEVSQKILKEFDISSPVMMLNLDLRTFFKLDKAERKFTDVSPYPSISRDLAFILEKEVEANTVHNEIMNKSGALLRSLLLFDVFEGKSIGDNMKSLAFSLSFSSPERTLKDEEIDKIVTKVVASVEKKFRAKLRTN